MALSEVESATLVSLTAMKKISALPTISALPAISALCLGLHLLTCCDQESHYISSTESAKIIALPSVFLDILK